MLITLETQLNIIDNEVNYAKIDHPNFSEKELEEFKKLRLEMKANIQRIINIVN